MRGADDKQGMMFTLISPEKRVPADHPLRPIKAGAEQLGYKMFRWFLDMNLDEPSFDHSTFSQNRERLLKHEVAVNSSRESWTWRMPLA